ncbi:MAG TPA: hypothetical protein VFH51_19710, partial [Myxococcota bacterium]|nr:hypothetical protein [Myxococcota bacterium]
MARTHMRQTACWAGLLVGIVSCTVSVPTPREGVFACAAQSDCADGYQCDSGVCAPVGTGGQACRTSSDCAVGQSTCVLSRSGAGECHAWCQNPGGSCQDGIFTGACFPVYYGGEGQPNACIPCHCAEGQTCAANTGSRIYIDEVGQAAVCSNAAAADCTQTFTCDTTAPVCATLADESGSCHAACGTYNQPCVDQGWGGVCAAVNTRFGSANGLACVPCPGCNGSCGLNEPSAKPQPVDRIPALQVCKATCPGIPCSTDSVCVVTSSGDRTCVPRCDGGWLCAANQACIPTLTATAGTGGRIQLKDSELACKSCDVSCGAGGSCQSTVTSPTPFDAAVVACQATGCSGCTNNDACVDNTCVPCGGCRVGTHCAWTNAPAKPATVSCLPDWFEVKQSATGGGVCGGAP